ncbi:MAG: hypothetical protein AB7S26_13155 [Sandaracinaceae bacterium]
MPTGSIPALALRALHAHPRATGAASLALVLAFGAGAVVGVRLASPDAEEVARAGAAKSDRARLRGAPTIDDAATFAPHRGIVIADSDDLSAGTLVEVLARALAPAPAWEDDYEAPPFLVRVGRAEPHWTWGDTIALLERGSVGGFVAASMDLDGDGQRDEVWHATARRTSVEDGREAQRGFLVFESARGVSTLPLGYDDGWGSAERVASYRLRDVVGSSSPDLVVLLDTTVCEVGDGGMKLQVIRFDGGVPERVFERSAYDPTFTGLTQYEIGYLRLDDAGIHARTLHVPTGLPSDEHPGLAVSDELWTRNDRGTFDHRVSLDPLRTEDGRVVEAVTGNPPFVDPPDDRGYVIADRDGSHSAWTPRRPRLADAHFEAVFDPDPERACAAQVWVEL